MTENVICKSCKSNQVFFKDWKCPNCASMDYIKRDSFEGKVNIG